MATIRELAASFIANPSGMRSALQAIKKDVNELQSASSKTSGKMSGDFAKSASNIGKSTSGIAKHFHNMSVGVQKSFESIGKTMTDTGKTLEGWGTNIQKTGKTATKALSPLTAFYTTAAVTGGKRMAANEQLDILMKNTFRTADAYDEAWDAVNGLTKGTAFMNSDVGGWLSQLVASNVELDKSEDIMKSILDFSVGSGQIGIEGEIHDIIMKAVRSGGWDQMTLDMLAQRGLNLAGHVANMMGITTESAQEMLKDGTISMEESLDYFVDAVQVGSEGAGGYFAKMEGSAQKGGETFTGAFTNMAASVAQLGEDMWKSGAWDQLKTAMNNITDFIYQLAPAMEPVSKVIASILATMVEWVQKLMNAFINLSPKMQAIIAGLSVVGSVLGPAIVMFGTFVGAVGKALNPLGSLFLRISKVFGIVGKKGLGGALKTLSSRFSFLAGPIGIAVGLFTTLYTTSKTFRETFNRVIGSIVDFGKKLYDGMKPAIETVIDSFKSMISGFKGIGESADGIGASLSPLLDIIGALAKLIMGALAAAFGVIISVISGAMQAVAPLAKALTSLISVVVNFGMAILSVFMGDFSKAMDYWKKGAQSSIDFVVGLWDAVVGFFKGFIQTIIDFFYGLYMTLVGNSIIPDMVNAIVDWFKNLGHWVADLVKSLVNSVVDFFKGLYNKTIEIFTWIIDFIGNFFTRIKEIFGSGLDWIDEKTSGKFKSITDTIRHYITLASDIIEAVWTFIKNTFKNVLAFLKALVTGDFQGMKDAISAQMQNIRDFLSTIWTAIKNFIRNTLGNIVQNVSNKFTEARETTSRIFTAIWNFLKNIWNTILNFIIDIVLKIYNRFKTGFQNTYNDTKRIFNAVHDFLRNLWNKTLKFIIDIVKKIFNRFKTGFQNTYNSTKDIFTNIWNFLKNIWNKVKNFISKSVSNIFTNVRDTWNNLKSKTVEIFQGIWKAITDKFDDIVQAAKDLPGRIGDGIKSMADGVAKGVKAVVNGLASGLESGINGVIKGINWVTGKLGIDKKIANVEIARYKKGTKNSGHPEDGLALVGDGGEHELIQTPDGQQFLSPDSDTLVNLPKGSHVLSGKNTKKHFEGIPQYKDGTTDGVVRGGAGQAAGQAGGGAIRKKAPNVWDYLTKPKLLLNKALRYLNIDLPTATEWPGKMLKGGFNTVKDAAFDFIKEKGEEAVPDAPSGGGASAWRSHIRKAAARMNESITNTHVNGIISQINRESGGNQKITQSSAVWDVNTAAGNPARGLLQYIPQTFSAYKMRGHGSIYSGYDQLLAFFNNTNWRRDLPYGKRGWGPTGARKYADGGIVDTKQLAWIAEGGWAESIISHDPAKRVRQQKIWQDTGDRLGFTNEKDNGRPTEITQNLTINSPKALSPSELSRKNLQSLRRMAMEWGL